LLLNYVLNVNNILYLLEKQLNSRIMKKYIVIATVLLSGMIFAQNNKPKLEAGDLVKATSFHDNGKVQQVGFIKMGNYKENGFLMIAMVIKQPWQRMIMVRSPENGFLNDTVLSEVDYSNNQIASVKIGSMML
jgi:hypothetical protein